MELLLVRASDKESKKGGLEVALFRMLQWENGVLFLLGTHKVANTLVKM